MTHPHLYLDGQRHFVDSQITLMTIDFARGYDKNYVE